MKKLLILLLVMPITCFVIWGGMNYSGFCWAEKRWLSDEELIEYAAKNIVREYQEAKKYPEFYQDPVSYVRKNPNCCYVGKIEDLSKISGIKPEYMDEHLEKYTDGLPVYAGDWFEKIFGTYNTYVIIYVDGKEMFASDIGRCGEYWNWF